MSMHKRLYWDNDAGLLLTLHIRTKNKSVHNYMLITVLFLLFLLLLLLLMNIHTLVRTD